MRDNRRRARKARAVVWHGPSTQAGEAPVARGEAAALLRRKRRRERRDGCGRVREGTPACARSAHAHPWAVRCLLPLRLSRMGGRGWCRASFHTITIRASLT